MFEGEKGRVLLELKSSGRFVERMSLDIRSKEDTASKLRMGGRELEARRQKCFGKYFFLAFFFFFCFVLEFYSFLNAAFVEKQKPVLAKAIREIKEMQKNLEKDIGSLISREVNIVGDFNNL